MNEPPLKRLSTLQIVGIAAAAVAGILLIAVFCLRWSTETRWGRFREELKTRVEQEKRRDPRRPVLRGTAEPGNAWDDYAAAVTGIVNVPSNTKLGLLVDRSPGADPSVLPEAFERGQVALDALSRGAARSTARYDYAWETGFSTIATGLPEYPTIAALAVLKARALQEAGKSREAAGLLLDVCQLGRDRSAGGPMLTEMIGIAVLDRGLGGLRELALSEKIEAGALEDLDRGLGALDGSFPRHSDALRVEALGIATNIERQASGSGFLIKFFFLSSNGRIQDALDKSAQASDQSWSASRAADQEIAASARSSWNPIARITVPSLLSSQSIVRERHAQLRLLRAAVHWKRTGELLDLDDPLGAKLKSAKTGEGMRFWSVGADGLDHSGSGEWRPKAGADIVLEARR
jgi:hypothetical protein